MSMCAAGEKITLNPSSKLITILEGASITIFCIPSNEEIGIQWLFNGNEIDSSNYQLKPPILNHNLTIPQLDISDNGTYTCEVNIRNKLEETITLNIVPSEFIICISARVSVYVCVCVCVCVC